MEVPVEVLHTLRTKGWDVSVVGSGAGAGSGTGVADPILRLLVGAADTGVAWLGSWAGMDEGTISRTIEVHSSACVSNHSLVHLPWLSSAVQSSEVLSIVRTARAT